MNKYLRLFDACKKETPLSKTSAEDTITQYNRAQVFLNNLEVSVEKYLTLVTQTYREEDYPPAVGAEGEAVDGLQVLIDKNIESLTDYTTKFFDIRGKNIEIFREIDNTLNPITRIARQVQAAPPLPMSGGFRLNADLRPHLLVKDCTLKEVTTFSESFVKYVKSSPNSIIPEGALLAHININVDQHRLTIIKDKNFSKENNLEEFHQV